MMPHPHHLAAIQTLRKITFRLLLAAACSVAPAQMLPSAPSFLNIPAETAPLTLASSPTAFDLFGRPVIPFTGSVRPTRNWSVFVSARPQPSAEPATLLASGAPARTPNGASLFSTAGTPSTAPPSRSGVIPSSSAPASAARTTTPSASTSSRAPASA